jgi:hypothetical protein
MALGAPEPRPGDPARERARLAAIAQADAEVGNRWEARDTADKLLSMTRMDLALARAGFGDVNAATTARREAVDLAIALGVRLAQNELVLKAIDPKRMAPTERAAFVAAVIGRGWTTEREVYDAAWTLASTPAERAAIERTWAGNDETGGPARPRLRLDELSALGSEVADLVHARFHAAIRDGKLDELRAVVAAMQRADPWDPEARVAALLFADGDAGRVPHTAELMRDASDGAGVLGAAARLDEARAKAPGAAGLTLALAFRYVRTDLIADARALAEPLVTAPGASVEVRETAELILALADLVAADFDAYARFFASHGRTAASAALVEAELGVAGMAARDDDATAFGAAAAWRAVDGRLPVWGRDRDELLLLAGSARTVAKPARAAIVAELRARGSFVRAGVIADCDARGRSTEDCRGRLEAAALLLDGPDDDHDGDDDGDDAYAQSYVRALRQLADLPDFPAAWLWTVMTLEPLTARSLAPLVRSFDGTRVALTEPFALARVAVEIIAGEAMAAQTALARHGALLRPWHRVWLRLAILDLKSGRHKPEDVFATFVWPAATWENLWSRDAGQIGAEERQYLETRWPGSGASASLARGLTSMGFGDHARALAELRPLYELLDGPEGGELAGVIAATASRVGERQLYERAAARAEALAPGGEAALLFETVRAWQDGQTAQALVPLVEFLRLRPDAQPVLREVVDGLASLQPGTDGGKRVGALLTTLGADAGWLQFMADEFAAGKLGSGADVVEVLAALADGTLAGKLGAARSGLLGVAIAAMQSFDERLGSCAPGEIRAVAREAAVYLGASALADSAGPRLAWLWWLAGDGQEAVAALGPNPSPWLPVVRLQGLRARLDDELARQVWNVSWRWGQDAERAEVGRRLLQSHGQDAGALATACGYLVDAELADEAVAPCWSAFLAGPVDADLVTRTSWALVSASDAAVPKGASMDALVQGAKARAVGDLGGTWLVNVALWQARRGHHQEAAALTDAAWRGGYEPDGAPGGEHDLAALAFRPRALRLQRGANSRQQGQSRAERHSGLMWWALFAGDPLVARAHQRASLAWALLEEADGAAQSARTMGDVIELVMADFADHALDVAGLRRYYTLGRDDEGDKVPELEALAKTYPGSIFVGVILAEEWAQGAKAPEALAQLERAWRRLPGNTVIGIDLINALVAQGEVDRAREVVRTVKAKNPADPRAEALREPTGAARPRLPVAAATAAGFLASYGRVSDAELVALAPTRRAALDLAAEAFFPKDRTGRSLAPSADADGLSLGLFAQARDSGCEGERCLTPLLGAWREKGIATAWTAPLELPAGRAHVALASGQDAFLLVASVPLGGRLFLLFAGGKSDLFEAKLPAIALLFRSFRALDLNRPPREAEALRARAGMPAGARHFVARDVVAKLAPGATECPLPELAAPGGGALLVDLLLSTAAPARRRALIACVDPTGPEAEPAALVTLLDEDSEVHAFGLRAVAAFPARVAADAEAVLEGAPELLISRQDDRLPAPIGLVEVIVSLPAAERVPLAERLARDANPTRRAAAYVAAIFAFGTLPAETLRETVRTGPVLEARLAAIALDQWPRPEDAKAARVRFDAMKAPLTLDERVLASTLLTLIWDDLDPADAPRFVRGAELVAEAPPAGRSDRVAALAEAIAEMGQRHAMAVALMRGAPEPVLERAAAFRPWVSYQVGILRAQAASARASVTVADLAKKPLASLTPGSEWMFARIGQPGLFVATAVGLAERLRGASDARSEIVHRVVANMGDQLGGAVFARSGGLDLTQPVECAAPGRTGGAYVCVATIKDRAQVEAALRGRREESGSGIDLPLEVARQGIDLPLAAGALPVLVHQLADHDAEPSLNGALRGTERFRSSFTVGKVSLERLVVVSYYDGPGTTANSEVWVVAGDRLWVFSSEQVAQVFLTTPPGRGKALANDPRFRRAVAGWRDLGALQALILSGAKEGAGTAGAGAGDVELEVAGSGERVRFVSTGATTASGVTGATGDETDVRPLVSLLPDDPVALIALDHRPDFDLDDVIGDELGASEGAAPPLWLGAAARTLALAWYPDARPPSMWARWVGAVRLDEGVRKAAAAHGLELPAIGQIVEVDGRFWTVHEGALIVGVPRALVEAAVARPAAAPASVGRRTTFLGRLDGARAALALGAVVSGRRGGNASMGLVRFAALIVSALDKVESEGWVDVKSKRWGLAATVTPRLSPAGAGTAVVDRWLESKSLRNSARLPRVVSRAELEGPIDLEIEVTGAEEVAAQAFPASPRLKVQALGDTRLRLEISPGPRPTAKVTPAPLADADQRRLTSSSDLVVADTPEIKDLARSIVPAGAGPIDAAVAVSAWVHRRLRYEITPEAIDAPAILARGRGDCTEFSLLTVSLLRALGIPAELREGMALDGDELVAHAWVAFHDGTGWRELEPTWGLDYVDAGHLEASVMDFVGLLSLDQFRVVKVSSRR